MLKEFKEFALKGNVMDLAVGVIIGGAFGKIVASLVNDILMPLQHVGYRLMECVPISRALHPLLQSLLSHLAFEGALARNIQEASQLVELR